VNTLPSDDGVAVQQDRLISQIARLQERQRELIALTADELNGVRQELEHQMESVQRPLLDEIGVLRRELAEVLNERERLRTQLHSVHNSIGNFLQLSPEKPTPITQQPARPMAAHGVHVRPLVVKAVRALPPKNTAIPISAPQTYEAVSIPVVVTQKQSEKPEEKPVPAKSKKKPDSSKHLRLIVRRVLLTLLVGAIGYAGLLGTKHFTASRASVNQVAGASTDTPATPAATPDPSQAQVAFRDTLWDTSVNPDYNISFDWPRNAAKLSDVPGGQNIWVVRKSGYLFRVARSDVVGDETLDQYWNTVKDTYDDSVTINHSSFKAQPAIILTPNGSAAISGTTYIIKYKNTFLTFWVQVLDPGSDDGQRLAKIVDSIKLL